MSEPYRFDTIDRAIIAELGKDGRATCQQIGEEIGYAAATVSGRIKRMQSADVLEIFAYSDFSAHGLNALLRIEVEVDGRPASQVAADLAEFSEVLACHLLAGHHDIELLVALPKIDGISDLIMEKFSQVAGIRSMNPSIILNTVKYDFDINLSLLKHH